MTWPNLFLLAAPRSGSTQLARWLDTHPDIMLGMVKEPNFFSSHEFDADYVKTSHLNDICPSRPPRKRAQFAVFRDEAAYRMLYHNTDATWRLDASTSYLACPEAPALIKKVAPRAKIIVMTRDPLERALSHYRLALRTGRTRASLRQEVEVEQSGASPLSARYLLRPSHQDAGLARVLDHFDNDQVHHLEFKALIEQPERALQGIAAFLNVAATFDLDVDARNSGVAPRFAVLNAALQRSGAKTTLRRLLPQSFKPVLKRIWFSASAKHQIPQADVDYLRRALGTL